MRNLLIALVLLVGCHRGNPDRGPFKNPNPGSHIPGPDSISLPRETVLAMLDSIKNWEAFIKHERYQAGGLKYKQAVIKWAYDNSVDIDIEAIDSVYYFGK